MNLFYHFLNQMSHSTEQDWIILLQANKLVDATQSYLLIEWNELSDWAELAHSGGNEVKRSDNTMIGGFRIQNEQLKLLKGVSGVEQVSETNRLEGATSKSETKVREMRKVNKVGKE